MKKSIFTAIIIITIIFFSSCKTDIEEITTPTFKLTSFQKESINGIYYCTATIKITNIPEEYSIDGILYANDIIKLKHNLPYNETLKYDYYKLNDNKYYFNLFGKHKGDIEFIIKWISKEDRNNYLIGWHLTYGFDIKYQTLMINLNTSII